MQYLTTAPFDRGRTAAEIANNARNGYYGLQDYAVAHWFDHLKPLRSNALPLPQNIRNGTLEALARFLKSYGVASKHQEYQGLKTPDDAYAALLGLPGDHLEMYAFIDIELRTIAIRRAIEGAFKSQPDRLLCEAYINLYGAVNVFKCSKPWCDYFPDGFGCDKLRDAHANWHDLPFQCSTEGCFAAKFGFDKEQKLQRHLRRYHDEIGDSPRISFPAARRKQIGANLTDAVGKGAYDSVKDLLDAGANPNNYRLSCSPIYKAAEQGRFEIFKLLLKRGADLTGSSKDTAPRFRQHTVLNAAITAGSSDIVNLIVSKLSLSDLDLGGLNSPSPLAVAAAGGSLDILLQLLAKVTPTTEFQDGQSFADFCTHWLLPKACNSQNTSVVLVKYIIENCPVRLDDHQGWTTAISAAAERGHYQLADILLSVGDLAHRYRVGAPLLAAISSKNFGIASTLLAVCGSRIGDFPQLQRILVASCQQGMLDVVGLALSCPGIDVNYRVDRDSHTPLLAAVGGAHLDIVEVLLGRRGIDITDCTRTGITPFLLAMISWSDKIVVKREQCVALLRAMRYHGPLHLGSVGGRAEMATIVENAVALSDADILDAIKGATGAGDDGHDLTYLWLVPAIKHRQLDLAGRLLSRKSSLSHLSTSEWREELRRELGAWENENELLVRKMLCATTEHYLGRGEGLYLISELLAAKSPDFAKMCIPGHFPASSLHALRLQERIALVRDIARIDEPDLLWPMIEALTKLGFGDILLWASLHQKGARAAAERCATIESLVDSGLANINIRKCELLEDGIALLGRPQHSMEGLEASFTPLEYLMKANRTEKEKLQTGSLEYYILNHGKVDVDARDGQGEPVSFSALTPVSQTRLSILLRVRGADPNACNRNGISLLEAAAERGNLGAVKLILSTGKCDQRFRDRAVEMASARGYNQILRELQKAPGRS